MNTTTYSHPIIDAIYDLVQWSGAANDLTDYDLRETDLVWAGGDAVDTVIDVMNLVEAAEGRTGRWSVIYLPDGFTTDPASEPTTLIDGHSIFDTAD